MQTGKPLVSVVIPVYCAQPYLRACMESLLQQSYDRLELIFVNDGSTDSSGMICDWYAGRHKNIRVIHQENRGVSAARNAGTALAQGDYIAFVDADDTVEKKYIENLVHAALQYEVEIAVCGCKLSGRQTERILTGREAVRALLYQKCFDTAPWGKLFRREIAEEVPFPEGMFFEDLAVVCQMFGRAEQVACMAEGGYCYRASPDGTMNGGDVRKLLDELKAADMMTQYVEQRFPELHSAAVCRRFSACCQVLMKLPEKGYPQERDTIWERLKADRRQVLRDADARYKNRAAALISYFGEGALRFLWQFRREKTE